MLTTVSNPTTTMSASEPSEAGGRGRGRLYARAPYTPQPHTAIERRLYAALATLGFRYTPQHPVGPYRVDAYLPGWGLAVESDGCPYHGCPACGWGGDVQAQERDLWRDRALLLRHGVLVIRIWGHALQTDADALASVKAALAPFMTSHLVNRGVTE